MDGKRIAITGVSRGLGRALADAFAFAGWKLVLHARDPVVAEERAAALGAVAVSGDLRDESLGPRLAAAAQAAYGGLDAIILNAGVLGAMTPLEDTDFDIFRTVMEVNVDAQLRLVLACLADLVAARGTVVWLSTGLGRFGLPRYGPYCASKHAMEGLMKVLAAEHGDDGLVSVAVAPGMVETDMLRHAIGPHDPHAFKTPAAAAAQFVRFLETIEPGLNGQSVEIDAVVGSVPSSG
ncbi:MAG: SDR family oxidoreductase [Myxococcota bacterium]